MASFAVEEANHQEEVLWSVTQQKHQRDLSRSISWQSKEEGSEKTKWWFQVHL